MKSSAESVGYTSAFSQSRSAVNSESLRSVARSLAVPLPSALNRNQSRPELPVKTSAALSSRTVLSGPSEKRKYGPFSRLAKVLLSVPETVWFDRLATRWL